MWHTNNDKTTPNLFSMENFCSTLVWYLYTYLKKKCLQKLTLFSYTFRKNKRMNIPSKKIIFRKILVKIQLTVSHTQFINSVTTQQLTPISTSYIVEHTTSLSYSCFFPNCFSSKATCAKILLWWSSGT